MKTKERKKLEKKFQKQQRKALQKVVSSYSEAVQKYVDHRIKRGFELCQIPQPVESLTIESGRGFQLRNAHSRLGFVYFSGKVVD